ncbi:hypothetical protein [Lysinibacillus sp. BPa_S21]|uniref:hypothetical protein n=1 Tax=Lysinibacillus sp. BPa_S21 TaxID=2932478 RepID=UPI002012553C|nr:hypothetical protein [Lysinibacillus sp. BPa_S21]MCL1694585.1 hypothetical protein [Lysinibacillus sp. BPa_S21]
MSGVKWLYISKECKVYKVPNPKNGKFKELKELSGQDVLKVMLYYETKDRKPDKLIFVEFDRVNLDSEGIYELNDERNSKVLKNAFQFIYNTPQELADNKSPFELPLAPSVPSINEKIALYEYLNKKFPNLGKNAPVVVENKICSLKKIHQEKINMIKEANKLRISSSRK